MTTPLPKVLIVDDDLSIRQLVAEYLKRQGYDTMTLPDANELNEKITRYNPALVVLDRMLPSGDGAEVCRRLRQLGEDIPIILVTGKDETVDRIIGLEAGADDYIGKPFDPRELLARIQTVLRRKEGPSALVKDAPVPFGEFVFNPKMLTLTKSGVPLKLTSGEFALLDVLIRNAGRPLSRERLLNLVHDNESIDRGDRAIDIAILRLRRVIEEDPKSPRWIQTVWGVGYRFSLDEAHE